MTKFIFISGGCCSAIGKGVVAASIGNLLSNLNYSVSIIKCDPYINIDPGTLNPQQHGEVFVTYDGGEVDLDFGHYERFLNSSISKLGSITTGSIYNSVITKERAGKYLGNTVQIFHITQEIKDRIYNYSLQTASDFVIIEIGGTVGDLESIPFIEAARQIQLENEPDEVCFIHCTYVFYLSSSGEFKTKPSQHSIKLLNSYGINPDILIARSESDLDSSLVEKLSTYCYIKKSNVISCPNLKSIYEVPLLLKKQKILTLLSYKLNVELDSLLITSEVQQKLNNWAHTVNKLSTPKSETLNVLIVGKYIKLKDSYISVSEALNHAALFLNKNININYLDVLDVNYINTFNCFNNDAIDAIVIPGGFGEEGVPQIKKILGLARSRKIKSLGICLGMQLMCIEYLTSTLNLPFNSTEFDKWTEYPLFDLLPEQVHGVTGGSLKLGTYPTKLIEDSIIGSVYNDNLIYERHRHRYEFNNSFRGKITKAGILLSGTSPDNNLINTIELNKEIHPFYVGVQFHPEFNSSIIKPHPLFVGLLC